MCVRLPPKQLNAMCSFNVLNDQFGADLKDTIRSAKYAHGSLLAFPLPNDDDWTTLPISYAFYREGDSYESLRAFNVQRGSLRSQSDWPFACVEIPIQIPLCVTSMFVDPFATYEQTIKECCDDGYMIELHLRPDDGWFRRTFGEHLSAVESDIVARWTCVDVLFAKDRAPFIIDADFGIGCGYGDSLFAYARTRLLAYDNNRPQLHSDLGTSALDLRALIAEYLVMCKTSKLVSLVLRQPLRASEDILDIDDTLANFKRGLWEFRRPGALLDEWRGFTAGTYSVRLKQRPRGKYNYHYVRLFGPCETYSKTRLLERASALCALTPVMRELGMEVLTVHDAIRTARESESRSRNVFSRSDAYGAPLHLHGLEQLCQWREWHREILQHTITLESLPFSEYVFLWLFEHLGLVHAPTLKRLRLISSVLASIRRVKAQRDTQRSDKK